MIDPEQKQKIVELIQTRDSTSIALAVQLAEALGWPLAQTYQLEEWAKLGYEAPNLFGTLILIHPLALQLFHETSSELVYLKCVYIRNHDIEILPGDWAKLIRLEILRLEAAMVKELPDSLGQLPKLKSLSLSHVKVKDLSHFLPKCEQLEHLYLSKLPYLSSLPEDWSGLRNLYSLILDDCKIAYLPPALGQLPRLQELIPTWNKLLEIPPWLGRFAPPKLRLSYPFAQTDYAHLPQGIGYLYGIKNLFIRCEYWLGNAPASNATLWLKLQGLTQLRSLSIQRHWIKDIQGLEEQHPELKSLNLTENQITSWPKGLALNKLIINANRDFRGGVVDDQLIQNLRHLELAFNGFSTLPQGLEKLQALEVLDLRDNQLATLPSDFAQLQNLQSLNLSNNPLNILPEVLRYLPKLRQLSLVNCGLSSLPDWLFELKNLETLCLSHNPFEALPKVLTQLPKLRRLYLRDVNLYRASVNPPQHATELQLRALILKDPAFQSLLTQVATWQELLSLHLGWQALSKDQFNALKRALAPKARVSVMLMN